MIDRRRRAPSRVAVAVAVTQAWVASGCGTVDVPVLSIVADGAGDGAPPGAAASPALGTLQEYCGGRGPPTLVDDMADGGAVSTCPDQLARRAFRYALCACNNYVSDHALVTDSFDGSHGPYDPSTAGTGASVGVNGDLHPTGPLQVGGSLWASNSTDITTAMVEVAGELHAQGEMRPAPSLTVQADAWMASGIQTAGDVTVGGTLHVPAGAPIDVTGARNFGTPVGAPFQVAPACDCEPSQFVDVAGIVATYQAHNDDAALNISPTVLENVQADVTMVLPCGRVYLTQIAANQASIHLSAPQRVALFVGGDISTSDFEIDVTPGGELDLFVAGTVSVRGAFLVGDPSNPARARTYVGGSSVNLQSAATLSGNLYAPRAVLTIGGSAPTTLYGAIFASALSAAADLAIHYDEAILTQSSAPACAPPATCATCGDCGGQACNSGTCGTCVDSSQCCAPLVCGPEGTCVGAVPAP